MNSVKSQFSNSILYFQTSLCSFDYPLEIDSALPTWYTEFDAALFVCMHISTITCTYDHDIMTSSSEQKATLKTKFQTSFRGTSTSYINWREQTSRSLHVKLRGRVFIVEINQIRRYRDDRGQEVVYFAPRFSPLRWDQTHAFLTLHRRCWCFVMSVGSGKVAEGVVKVQPADVLASVSYWYRRNNHISLLIMAAFPLCVLSCLSC